jgi:iron complex outermembrane receptor protein
MKTYRRLGDAAAVLALMPTLLWAQTTESEQPVAAADTDSKVVVTASRGMEALPSMTPSQRLSGPELVHRRQGGLGETLAGLPGIHLDSFGGGASRPVIRGQTLPRIEILSDGAALFDVSSVSPDHAVTTDPLLLDAIEIIRGPAAVRYGGNAVNGAINLIDSKIPTRLPADGLSGATEVRYGTGDNEKTAVGRVTAGVGQFALHAEGVRRHAGNYEVPGTYGAQTLRDSFAGNTSYAVGASWIRPQAISAQPSRA